MRCKPHKEGENVAFIDLSAGKLHGQNWMVFLLLALPTTRYARLLAYLVVESDRPHHREHLADLLWSGYPQRSARQNLSQTLSILRNAIRDRDVVPAFLHITNREIQFNIESGYWLDVDQFSNHMNAAKVLLKRNPDDVAVVEHCKEAAALHRGDFLADLMIEDSIPFEEWALLHR